MKKFFLILPCFLVILGCENEKEPLKFTTLSLEKTDDKNCDSERENCTYISISVPQAKEETKRAENLNQLIQKHVIDLIDYKEEKKYESLEQFSLHFINDYELARRQFPEEKTPWEAQVTGKVAYRTKNLVSIKFNLELFTGGAHGYASESYLNFNPETGRLYRESELFTPDFKNFAEDLFRKKYNIPQNDTINSTGFFFKNDVFQLPENIGFQKKDIILLYNPYEVAAYSEGSIQVKIPRQKAESFLKIN